jgi:hypothetical protein
MSEGIKDMNQDHNSQLERGQSLIEFTISMVLVMILLTGLVDMGRAIFTYMSLRDAAQEGATFGSVNPDLTEAIEDRVYGSSSLLQGVKDRLGGNSPIEIQVDLSGDGCIGDSIEVSVLYDEFPLTMPFIGAILGKQSMDIGAAAMDTILSPPCE